MPYALLIFDRAVGDQLLSLRHNITKHRYCLSSNTFMCAYNLNISLLLSTALTVFVELIVITNRASQIVECRRRAIRGHGSHRRLERSRCVKYRFIGYSHIHSVSRIAGSQYAYQSNPGMQSQ